MTAQLYLDMDGVLADFDAGAAIGLETDNPYKWEWINGTEAFWEKLHSNPNFFFDLPPMKDAMLLWGNVRHLNPKVLTALPKSRDSDVELQKRMWIAKYLDPSVEVICCYMKDKPKYCKDGDILVDDRAVNRKIWEENKGVFILHTSAEETLKQLL